VFGFCGERQLAKAKHNLNQIRKNKNNRNEKSYRNNNLNQITEIKNNRNEKSYRNITADYSMIRMNDNVFGFCGERQLAKAKIEATQYSTSSDFKLRLRLLVSGKKLLPSRWHICRSYFVELLRGLTASLIGC
jgi:hypothetical protein